MTPPNDQIYQVFGTSGDDDLIGSARRERFFGFDGRDRIYAKEGNDELYGGSGDDLLDGGPGQDLMFGESGNDKYRVDDPGDATREDVTPGQDDGGTDTVVSEISFSLGDFFEKLELQTDGTGKIDGAGNDLNNSLKGTDGINVLSGAGGSDTIYGYGGDDILIGGAGRDYLTGGLGADIFVLKYEPGEWDKIYDFTGVDRLGIYATEFGLSEGAGLTGGVLSGAYFIAANDATASGHGQFVYRANKSELLWDPDGTGAAKPVRVALIDGAPVTAAQIIAEPETATASVHAFSTAPRVEGDGRAFFTLALSRPINEDVLLTCSTQDGSAVGGQDFIALSSHSVLIKAGSTTAYVPVDIINDDIGEDVESFSLRIDAAQINSTGAPLAIGIATASATIKDEGPVVFAETFTAPFGMTDPSGVVYDPATETLFMVDSEVDEAPFFQPVNFFSLETDGSLNSSLVLPFTSEPTGLAIDSANRHLFITDDDAYRVFCVDADDPTNVLWSFDTLPFGGNDPEDIAFDTDTGNLFICNGLDRTIIEVNAQGTQLLRSIVLPNEIIDPEALAFDTAENAFYVGGGFSDKIWKLDLNGAIVEVITILEDARHPETGRRVNVKDLELAPASDGSSSTHLYVADYGWSHEADGRLIEIDLGDEWSGIA